MSRPLIITNVKYKGTRRRGRGQGTKGLRATLKYLQYRDDRESYARPSGEERWVNCGLGGHYREIFEQCTALKSRNVLAWTYVISPEPDLMTLLPDDQRQAFMRVLTEAVVERYYEARDCVPQYSYVVHEAETKDGRPHTHAYVILPGTAETEHEGRQPFLNYKRQGHLDLLDRIANEELAQGLDRLIGADWRLTVEALGVASPSNTVSRTPDYLTELMA